MSEQKQAKRPRWMSPQVWQTLQAIQPNPPVATGPTGQGVVLLGPGIAVSTMRGVQDAVELLQPEPRREVSP